MMPSKQWSLQIYLVDLCNLGRLGHANHCIWTNKFDKRKFAFHGDGRGQCSLAATSRTMQQNTNKWCTGRLTDLIYIQFSIGQNLLFQKEIAVRVTKIEIPTESTYLDVGGEWNDMVLYALLQLCFGNTKGWRYFLEGSQKVIHVDLHVLHVCSNASHRSDLTHIVNTGQRTF